MTSGGSSNDSLANNGGQFIRPAQIQKKLDIENFQIEFETELDFENDNDQDEYIDKSTEPKISKTAKSKKTKKSSSASRKEAAESKIESTIPKSDELVKGKEPSKKQQVDMGVVVQSMIGTQLFAFEQIFGQLDETAKSAFGKLEQFSEKLSDEKVLDKSYEATRAAIERMPKERFEKLPEAVRESYKDREKFRAAMRAAVERTLGKMREDSSFDHKTAIAEYHRLFDEDNSPIGLVINTMVRDDSDLQAMNKSQAEAFALYARQMGSVFNRDAERYQNLRRFEAGRLIHLQGLILEREKANLEKLSARELANNSIYKDGVKYSVIARSGNAERVHFAGESFEDAQNKVCRILVDANGRIVISCDEQAIKDNIERNYENLAEDKAFSDVVDLIDERLEKALAPKTNDGSAGKVISDEVKKANIMRVAVGDELANSIAKGDDPNLSLSDKFKQLISTLSSQGLLSSEHMNSSLLDRDGKPTDLAKKLFDLDFVNNGGIELYSAELKHQDKNIFSISASSILERAWESTSLTKPETFNSSSIEYTPSNYNGSAKAQINEPQSPREAIAQQYGVEGTDIESPGALEQALKQAGYSFKDIVHIVGDNSWVIQKIKETYNIPSFLSPTEVDEIVRRIMLGEDPDGVIKEVVSRHLSKEAEKEIDEALRRSVDLNTAERDFGLIDFLNIDFM